MITELWRRYRASNLADYTSASLVVLGGLWLTSMLMSL